MSTVRGRPKQISKVVQVAWQRNGVGGLGFHAVIFEIKHTICSACKGDGAGSMIFAATGKPVPCPTCGGSTLEAVTRKMVASVFDAPGCIAVFDVEKIADPDFGENSWCGTNYEPELRAAIRTSTSDGSVRAGPFGIPIKRKNRNRKLKQRVRDAQPVNACTLCTCGHPYYAHGPNGNDGNCTECQINPRTNKSRCRHFKTASEET